MQQKKGWVHAVLVQRLLGNVYAIHVDKEGGERWGVCKASNLSWYQKEFLGNLFMLGGGRGLKIRKNCRHSLWTLPWANEFHVVSCFGCAKIEFSLPITCQDEGRRAKGSLDLIRFDLISWVRNAISDVTFGYWLKKCQILADGLLRSAPQRHSLEIWSNQFPFAFALTTELCFWDKSWWKVKSSEREEQ